jgi:hypothetical protein
MFGKIRCHFSNVWNPPPLKLRRAQEKLPKLGNAAYFRGSFLIEGEEDACRTWRSFPTRRVDAL